MAKVLHVTGGDTSALPVGPLPVVLVRLHVSPYLSVWSIWDPCVEDWLRGRTGRRRAWSIEGSAREVLEHLGGAVAPCRFAAVLAPSPRPPMSRARARELRKRARQVRRQQDAVARMEGRGRLPALIV